VKVKVEGLKELDRALGELSTGAAKGVLRRVGRQALEPTDRAWRARAPHLTGQLEESGSIGSALSRRQRSQHRRESTVEVFSGPGPNPQAITQEFGTFKEPAQPFLRPAWEATKMQVLESVKDLLATEIGKAAARAAKKAARLAKKAGG
jgi:HK97 gp10 family phage protein